MTKVRFDQIAKEVRNTFSGDKAGVPIVGLEHIIPNELLLSDHDIDTENTFTKAFKKGQILFGRRRAYQQKAAVATFDGICSGDITVIEPIDGAVCPELLPFIIQNERFFEHAVRGSAGSLSPRVKWEHLSSYEIELPSYEEQVKLANTLWAAYNLKTSYKTLLTSIDEMVKSQFIEMFGQSSLDNGIIGDYLLLKAGKAMPADRISSSKADGMFPCFGGNGIRGYVDSYNYDGDYAIIGRQGALCGNVCLAQGKFYATEHAVVVTPKAIVDSTWLFFALNQMNLNQYARGVAQPGLAVNELEKLPFSVPDISKQIEFSIIAKQADKSKFELKKSIEAIDKVIKSLINNI